MKKYLIGYFIVALLCPIAHSWGSGIDTLLSKQIAKDTSWNHMSKIIVDYDALSHKKNLLSKEEFEVLQEFYLREFRNKGIVYWANSKDVKQRCEWLILTTTIPPSYYDRSVKDFDTIQKQRWNRTFKNLKRTFLEIIDTLPLKTQNILRNQLETSEIYGSLLEEQFSFQTTHKKIDLNAFTMPIISLVKETQTMGLLVSIVLKQTTDFIFNNYKSFGITEDKLLLFLNNLNEANIPQLSSWVIGKKRLLELKNDKLAFTFTTYDNKQINLREDLKGKVVLLDFWATWCSVCLNYMPAVKRIFEKYHDKGFEVLSFSINKNTDRKDVLTIEKKMDSSWPLAIIGDDKLKIDIWKKFAFTSVPQLILLDKDGRLIENNGELMNEVSLERLVKKALEQ